MAKPHKNAEHGLTPKQELFCNEYLVDLNATQAAIRSHYSKKTAFTIGVENLRKPLIIKRINELKAKIAEKIEITPERIARELALMGFANMDDYMTTNNAGDPVLDFSRLSRDQAAALQEVTVDTYMEGAGKDARRVKKVKFKLADKRAALVDLGKYVGMFNEDKPPPQGGDTFNTIVVMQDQMGELLKKVAGDKSLGAITMKRLAEKV